MIDGSTPSGFEICTLCNISKPTPDVWVCTQLFPDQISRALKDRFTIFFLKIWLFCRIKPRNQRGVWPKPKITFRMARIFKIVFLSSWVFEPNIWCCFCVLSIPSIHPSIILTSIIHPSIHPPNFPSIHPSIHFLLAHKVYCYYPVVMKCIFGLSEQIAEPGAIPRTPAESVHLTEPTVDVFILQHCWWSLLMLHFWMADSNRIHYYTVQAFENRYFPSLFNII